MTKSIQTEVLVIGGGATGTGVARDLAMRGFKTTLVEKRDYTHGTTGRYHGLLHSGGRYTVKDPLAARECIQENRILRRIMPHCIEDTGGFFVQTPSDEPDYAQKFLDGCRTAGIPVEEISIRDMLAEEALLNPAITRCFRVPDGAADSFLGAHANVRSAQEHGAGIFNYHPVVELIQDGKRVAGAHCRDLIHDEDILIRADMVVNAAGAWSGIIAGMTGIALTIIPGKGVMIAANHRLVNTVVNRCHMPADGDILVPAHTVAIIGTTDVRVEDPEHYGIEPWERRLMLEEGEKLIPGFKDMRMLRAWAGVRPLYQEAASGSDSNRDVTRAFVLLDHESRDGVTGLITITSGKWTTYRKMAEVTVDLVCKKLGTQRDCRTHLEALPGQEDGHYHSLGARLEAIEKEKTYGQLICECELATYAQVEKAILEGAANTLDDIRRDVRLGMGPCQAGFCTLRAAGMLHRLQHIPIEQTNASLRDFLQERWKGVTPVLWGGQLRQERLNELVYRSLLGVEQLPGPKYTHLKAPGYTQPVSYEIQEKTRLDAKSQIQKRDFPAVARSARKSDLVVIGAGLAGLVIGWQAAKAGKKVKIISKGWGALHWHTGCIDVLGRVPGDEPNLVTSPTQALHGYLTAHPGHPYALAGLDRLENALGELQALGERYDYPLEGDLSANFLLPTSVGARRPTCLAPATMAVGNNTDQPGVLIVGFTGFLDFYPSMIAINLEKEGMHAQGRLVELPSLKKQRFISGRVLAECFESTDFRVEAVHKIKQALAAVSDGSIRCIGLPAVLGIKNAYRIHQELENQLEMRVFEIPTLPPSIPGIRLHTLLKQEIESLGGQVYDGMEVVGFTSEDRRITAVYSEAAARPKMHAGENFVLATGGFLGGGFTRSYDSPPLEGIFDLPLSYPGDPHGWFEDDFLAPDGQPLFKSGLRLNANFQPVDDEGRPVFENLYAAGNLAAGYDPLLEGSLEGVALASGFAIENT